MEEKRCIRCKQIKPLASFCKCRIYKDGLAYYCRECSREKHQQQRQANLEHYRKYQREYARRYKKKTQGRYSRLKANAKHKSIPFGIAITEFVTWFGQQVKVCEYCGQRLVSGDGSTLPNSLNVDRKDNSKGYEMGNLCLACRRCNMAKGSWFTYEQMKEIAQKYFWGV